MASGGMCLVLFGWRVTVFQVAIKALQEVMARIESLEARLAVAGIK